MQGPNYLDLARTLANERLDHTEYDSRLPVTVKAKPGLGVREHIGHMLIGLGERLAPSDVPLQVSTGPPCP